MTPPLGLGRRHAPDQRDSRFPLSALLPDEPSKRTHRYWGASGWWGDQGNTSRCVAFAWLHWLEDGPVTQPGPGPILDPNWLYKEAQRNDEFPGEDYDGTSVRAGAKVLQGRSLIKEYRWAFDLPTLIQTVLEVGPVVVGTNWYQGMFSPDRDGVVRISGSLAGGHAYVINGANTKTGVARGKNSWGRDWGRRGLFYIPFEDLERLIKENGEACLAVEIRAQGAVPQPEPPPPQPNPGKIGSFYGLHSSMVFHRNHPGVPRELTWPSYSAARQAGRMACPVCRPQP